MKITYRPEIDGLRAIAVIAVILYHSQITLFGYQPFKGGFIGVDIFFVISGYLITSIILKELITTDNFSFKYFYERRARRILPALLFVITLSLIFSFFFLYPSRLAQLCKTLISSIIFVSNYYFYFGEDSYFFNQFYTPFIHTWSLSIEEQFYILFPFFIFLLFKYCKKNFFLFLILSFLISLISTNFGNDDLNFYSLHTRFWELLSGSILSYLEIVKKKRKKIKKFKFLSSLGLLIIILSIYLFNKETPHPSIYTLIPIMGVSFIIWFSNNDEISTKILSSKPFVFIGLISYSLYLIHLPIFAFERILDFSSGIEYKILIIILVFILSSISYFFIEKPSRLTKKFRFVLIPLIIAIVAIFFSTFFIIKNDGFKYRFDDFKKVNRNFEIDNFALNIERQKLSQKYNKKSEQKKEIEKFIKSNKKRIVILGDSFADDLFNVFYLNKKLFSNYEFFKLTYSLRSNESINKLKNNKLVYENTEIFVLSFRWWSYDLKFLDNLVENLKKDKKIVIITSSSNEYFTSKYDKFKYDKTLIDELIISKEANFSNYFGQKNKYFLNRKIHSDSVINKKLKKYSKENKLIYLNKEDYLCDISKMECDYVTKEGYKIFFDSEHYTIQGAKYLGEKIYKTNWFKVN